MDERRKLGAVFPPMETRREVIVRAAIEAEVLGYDAFFVTEAWGLDASVLVAEIATKTERILLGTSILNVWSRSSATLAMSAATLADLSGGRFVLGLGAATPQLVEGLHDRSYTTPIAQLRQVTTQVRALLEGDRIPLSAGNAARPMRLATEPHPVDVYLAGLAPASVRLAGEAADGWIPFFYPLSGMTAGIELVVQGSVGAGRPVDACRICPVIASAVDEDEITAQQRAAWWVNFYLTSMGPIYARTLEIHRYGAAVAAVRAAAATSTTPMLPHEAAVLLDEVTVWGPPGAARDRLARWYEAGASLPIIALPPNRPWDELEQTLRALAPAPTDPR